MFQPGVSSSDGKVFRRFVPEGLAANVVSLTEAVHTDSHFVWPFSCQQSEVLLRQNNNPQIK